ncbi:hypothetical protein IWQ61_004937 [Dispira simplex]|nr:hypothetical protein IWQ61_004937 [Dispira simplex]
MPSRSPPHTHSPTYNLTGGGGPPPSLTRTDSQPRVVRTQSSHSVTSVTSMRLQPSGSQATLRRLDTSGTDHGSLRYYGGNVEVEGTRVSSGDDAYSPEGLLCDLKSNVSVMLDSPTGFSQSTAGGNHGGERHPRESIAPLDTLRASTALNMDMDRITFFTPYNATTRSGPSPLSSQPLNDHEPTASVFSSVVNLCNTILGSGILAMPTAMASVGLLLGSWVIMFSGMASALGLYFLGYCARYVEGRNASFFTVSQLTYPGAAVFFDLAIAIKCFGVSISYLIIFGEVMPRVVAAQMGNDIVSTFTYSVLTNRRFWITLSMAVVGPLSFLRKLDSLRYTSMVALLALFYLVLIVVIHFLDPARIPPGPGSISMIKLSPSFFTNLPIFVFAFTCHQNIFSVYNELRDNSPRKVKASIHIAISTAAIAYLVVAILGYLTFGDDVLPNIILMYKNGPMVVVGQFAIGVLMLLSYPLQCHPCRACLDKVITGYVLPRFKHSMVNPGYALSLPDSNNDHSPSDTTASTRPLRGIAGSAHCSGYEALQDHDDEESHRSPDGGITQEEMVDYVRHRSTVGLSRTNSQRSLRNTGFSFWMFNLVTLLILVLSYLVAISVSQLDLVLSFVGSTGSTVISFILPVCGDTLQMALKHRSDLREDLYKIFQGTVNLLTTGCVVRELVSQGEEAEGALIAAKRFERRRCPHKTAVSGVACIREIIGESNPHHYAVAMENRKGRDKLRLIPGVPLLHFNRSMLVIEPMGQSTLDKIKEIELNKTAVSSKEIQALEALVPEVKEERERAQIQVPKKRKLAKGPNPLSCKKKKSNQASHNLTTLGPDSQTGTKKKRPRKSKAQRRAQVENAPGSV